MAIINQPHADRIAYRQGMQEWIVSNQPRYFVTLAFNDANPCKNKERYKASLKAFYACTDKRLLGHKWLQRYEHRPVSFSFLEKPDVNPHWHLLVVPANGIEYRCDYISAAEHAWGRLCKPGSIKIQELNTLYDIQHVTSYATKELEGVNWNSEQFVLSTAFASKN